VNVDRHADPLRSGYARRIDGRVVDLYTLRNAQGMTARLTNHGARLVQLTAPDRHGRMDDVVLGYDSVEALQAGHISAGATIGRFAGRIRDARFRLDGVEHRLSVNDGAHHLHGGRLGSRYKIFAVIQRNPHAVRFATTFADAEEGYPGRCELSVEYVLTDDNALSLSYEASTDAATVVNFTHHSFWNLAGQGHGDILDHRLTINADRYAPVDGDMLPRGEVLGVQGTPLDFTRPTPIGERIDADFDQLGPGQGYSANYLLREGDGGDEPRYAARLHEPLSGRLMEVYTTEPALLFFSGNGFGAATPRDIGKGGAVYCRHAGFALETQHLPDSPNIAHFPSTVLRPGERFHSRTDYKFSVLH
jgi:aldose 1-epimerase